MQLDNVYFSLRMNASERAEKISEMLIDVIENFVGNFSAGEGILISSVSLCPNISASKRLASLEL